MKKIIYSLVIMIAAGSLFTSCIEQVEPEGIQNLRDAKAEYIRALKDLRAADAEYRRAEAEVQRATAALQQAHAAHRQAEVEMQKLLNEAQELANQQTAEEVKEAIDQIKKRMAVAEEQHKIDMVQKEEELAKAMESLRKALRDIALAAKDLTAEEKAAVTAAIDEYDTIFAQVKAQEIAVLKAEQALAKAELKKEMGKYNPDLDWDSETHAYRYLIDIYNSKIERAKGFIAEDEALLENIPAFEDVEQWGEELAGYQNQSDSLEYSRHTLTQEAAAYYVQYVHDGVKAYNDAIDAWEEKNPAIAAPGKKPTDPNGKPTYTTLNKIKIGDKEYPAGTTFGAALADSVALPTLENKGTPAYAKLSHILASYIGVVSPVNETDGILVDTPDYLIVANQNMKDFILGTDKGDVGTQKFSYKNSAGTKVDLVADYGLKGAVSVLKRDKVLNPDTPTDPEEAKKAAEDAKKAWQADHDTLKNGLLKYQPYIDAKKALEAAQKDADANGSGMVKAIEDLLTSINLVNVSTSPITYSGKDTLGLIEDIVNFAKAREKYLDYSNVTGATKDSNYFYYAAASSPLTPGSVKFSDMTKAGFVEQDRTTFGKNGAYAFDETTGNAYVNAVNPAFGHEAFICVVTQLFGAQLAAKIEGELDFTETEWVNLINDGTNYTAFYNTYKYVPKTTTEPAKITYIDDSPYTPKDLADAQAAVDAAIADYKACYERYWNEIWPATGLIDYTTSEADAKTILEADTTKDTNIDSYTLATFTEPFIITSVWDDANVPAGTNALAAILGSVDKAAANPVASNLTFFGGPAESIVFGTKTNPTDLNKYLYAEYQYFLALNPASGDIKVIEEWVAAVEKAFTDGATDAVAAAKAAYEADLKVYNDNKAKYDKYQAALEAFTGTRVDGTDTVINGIVKITGTYPDVASIQYVFELVDVDAGEWIETLGAEQLKLAEKYFPEFPAKLKAWKAEDDRINDLKAHNQILIDALNPVYAASAKVINHTNYPTWKRNADGEIEEGDKDIYDADFLTLIENYKKARKDYEDALKADIKDQTKVIDDNMKLIADFESGVPALDLEIAEAQSELDLAKAKLARLEEKLAFAKENLDKILEYINSLDNGFVIP